MKTIEYLSNADMASVIWIALAAGLGVVVMCGLLSVLVVVKKLGFIGQGVSHSAFGGIGVAALLAASGLIPAGTPWQLGVVSVFCLGTALGMAALGKRERVPVDTAIGLFLVTSMALGAVLTQQAQTIAMRSGRVGVVQSWESILFGSILTADTADVFIGTGACVLVIATLWWFRRPMLFWALDDETASAFGVNTAALSTLVMVLLSIAIVVSMKLAGVVLATAVLVLPGATALRLSDRLWRVLGISVMCGVIGLVAGLVASMETGWQPGPCVVMVMTAEFATAMVISAILRKRGAGQNQTAMRAST